MCKKISSFVLTVLIAISSNMLICHASEIQPVLTFLPGSSFESMRQFDEGLMPTTIDGKQCYISEAGYIAIPYEKLKPLFDSIGANKVIDLGSFENGTAIISENIILEVYSEGFFSFESVPKYLIDSLGNPIYKVSDADLFYETIASRRYLPRDYDTIFMDSLATDQNPGFTVYTNSVNDYILKLPKRYDLVYSRYDTLMPAWDRATDLCVYLDKKGTVVIDGNFSRAYPFYNGYALTLIGGTYKFIDEKGNYVSDLEWKTGFMNCIESKPDLYFEFDKGNGPVDGMRLVQIEMAEVKDGIISTPIKVYINNYKLPLLAPAEIVDGRIMLPVPTDGEAPEILLGMIYTTPGVVDLSSGIVLEENTYFDLGNNKAFTSKTTELDIAAVSGRSTYLINGIEKDYGVKAYVKNNMLYIPIRAMADALGYSIEWNADANLVVMSPQ